MRWPILDSHNHTHAWKRPLHPLPNDIVRIWKGSDLIGQFLNENLSNLIGQYFLKLKLWNFDWSILLDAEQSDWFTQEKKWRLLHRALQCVSCRNLHAMQRLTVLAAFFFIIVHDRIFAHKNNSVVESKNRVCDLCDRPKSRDARAEVEKVHYTSCSSLYSVHTQALRFFEFTGLH